MADAAYAAEIDELDLTVTPQANTVPAVRRERPALRAPKRSSAKSDAGSILGAIMQAASNPEVDADKVERLMGMYRTILADEAERAFNVAMREAQAEMRPISADAENSHTNSRYATYAKLDGKLRPIYTAHGFSLSFDEADSPKPDHIRVLCYVSHDAGHTRTYRKDMPADGKGARGGDVMTKTHAAGAAASYGARYLLKGIFNIAVGEDDRDGNEVPEESAPTISDDQVNELRQLLKENGKNEARFLVWAKLEKLEDMWASRFYDARRAIVGAK